MRLTWLIWAAFLALMMAYLHVEATLNFLYWRYEWFDIPMHFLGGVVIAVFLIGFFVTKRHGLIILAFILAVVGWEVFEYVFGLPREANYPLDTVMDLVLDTLGGLLAYVIARKTIWRSN